MNRVTRISLALCALLIFTVATCVGQTYTPQPFSADMAITPHNGQKVTGKFYFSPPSLRMDMNPNGRNVSSITDGASQTTYIVMHDQHMYMEMHADAANPFTGRMPTVDTNYDPNNPCPGAHKGGPCKKVGTETVNGRLCDKWQGASDQGTETLWMDQKLHFPIKTQRSDGSEMEFSNVKEGKPDASLFQPPAGYRKMDMGMMGGRPPQ